MSVMMRSGWELATSPSVMKEISEPRGCVCGVLPAQGPAACEAAS